MQLTLAYNNTVRPLVVSPRATDVYDVAFVPKDAPLGIKLYGSKLLDKQMVLINTQEILELYPSSSSGRYVAVIGKSGKSTQNIVIDNIVKLFTLCSYNFLHFMLQPKCYRSIWYNLHLNLLEDNIFLL